MRLPQLALVSFALQFLWCFGVAAEDTNSLWSPAYFDLGSHSESPRVIVFPINGTRVELLSTHSPAQGFISFRRDGNGLFVQPLDLGSSTGITEVQFHPPKVDLVRGSSGLGPVWYLTDQTRTSGRIFVSGVRTTPTGTECGAYEIYLADGTLKRLRTGSFPECGGGKGPISPDGRRVLRTSGKRLEMVDIETGAKRLLGDGMAAASWSPDGSWIAANHEGSLVLIDADATTHKKNLGESGEGPAQWSQDSKSLLLSKTDWRCGLYSGSLLVIDVSSGRKAQVKSSHCAIYSSNTFGWVFGAR
jgi:hypothetical protein